jgi:ATP/maltotriose-dependent transcriptional regulator MalT
MSLDEIIARGVLPASAAAKKRARNKLQQAVRSRWLDKPNVCEGCGAPGKVTAHHANYSLALTVDWLCPKCHVYVHSRLRNTLELPDSPKRGFDALSPREKQVYWQSGFDALSPREKQVYWQKCLLVSNRKIALNLGIAHRTVKNHVTAIRDKLRRGSWLTGHTLGD